MVKKFMIGFLLVAIVIFGGIKWEMYRWHTFQEVTKSDISYLKWRFVIDDSNSGR
jgi:hypothetical protein